MKGASTFVLGPGEVGAIGVLSPGVKRKIQILFSNPPDTYMGYEPSAATFDENTSPKFTLCGDGK
jgi:hypothetical protein